MKGKSVEVVGLKLNKVVLSLSLMLLFSSPAWAAVDPVKKITDIKDMLVNIALPLGQIGMVIGVIWVGRAMMSHDPKGKIDGAIIFAAGALIAGVGSYIG